MPFACHSLTRSRGLDHAPARHGYDTADQRIKAQAAIVRQRATFVVRKYEAAYARAGDAAQVSSTRCAFILTARQIPWLAPLITAGSRVYSCASSAEAATH